MAGLEGLWRITVKSSLGEFTGTGEMKLEGKRFSCLLTDAKSGASYLLNDGICEGRSFRAAAKIKQGPFNISASLEGTLSEDGESFSGKARAMGMSGSFEGRRIGTAK